VDLGNNAVEFGGLVEMEGIGEGKGKKGEEHGRPFRKGRMAGSGGQVQVRGLRKCCQDPERRATI
jgi:hypothetical protein